MNTKILIIGQAPPIQEQTFPYDTTMLYNWFEMLSISKHDAQDIFEFEAMTDIIPERDNNGAHKKPSIEEQNTYYEEVLKHKIENANCVLLLGRVAMDYFGVDQFFTKKMINDTPFYGMYHPSIRNKTRADLKINKIRNMLFEAVKENLFREHDLNDPDVDFQLYQWMFDKNHGIFTGHTYRDYVNGVYYGEESVYFYGNVWFTEEPTYQEMIKTFNLEPEKIRK